MVKKLINKLKEVRFMMAMLWAQEIMYGNKKFSQVPPRLKEQVRQILVNSDVDPEIFEE